MNHDMQIKRARDRLESIGVIVTVFVRSFRGGAALLVFIVAINRLLNRFLYAK